MTNSVADTLWVERDGNVEATSGSVATLDDPSGNTIVDPITSTTTIVDTGVVLAQTPTTSWALNDGS